MSNDIYKVRLEKIQERIGRRDNEIFVFTFRVIDPNVDIRPYESWMEKKNYPTSKVNTACRALLECDENIFTVPSEALIGQECYVKAEGRTIKEFISISDYEKGVVKHG